MRPSVRSSTVHRSRTWRADGVALHRRRLRGAHVVRAVVVPGRGGPRRHPAPHRRRRRIGRLRRFGRGDARPVEVRGRRAPVLEHAPRPDAQVRLVVVPEHHRITAAGVAELQVVAEIHHRHLDAGDVRHHPEQLGLVVAGLDTTDAVRLCRWCRDHDAAADEQRHDGEGADPARHASVHPVSAAVTSATRRSRARATRERIVPTGTPQISAASAYEQPTICVSTNATRWSRSRPSTSTWSECAPATSPMSSPTWPWRCSIWRARRRRRIAPRTESAQARRAIANNQVRALESPRNAGSARQARTNVSCVASSASFSPTRWSANRHTSAWLARIACSSEARSPSRASSHRRVRSSTATDDTGGTPEPS